MTEHPNCQAIEKFLEPFAAPIKIANTERINGALAKDAYTASHWDRVSGRGFTVIAWGDGLFKCVVECVGKTDAAGLTGELVSKVIEPK